MLQVFFVIILCSWTVNSALLFVPWMMIKGRMYFEIAIIGESSVSFLTIFLNIWQKPYRKSWVSRWTRAISYESCVKNESREIYLCHSLVTETRLWTIFYKSWKLLNAQFYINFRTSLSTPSDWQPSSFSSLSRRLFSLWNIPNFE